MPIAVPASAVPAGLGDGTAVPNPMQTGVARFARCGLPYQPRTPVCIGFRQPTVTTARGLAALVLRGRSALVWTVHVLLSVTQSGPDGPMPNPKQHGCGLRADRPRSESGGHGTCLAGNRPASRGADSPYHARYARSLLRRQKFDCLENGAAAPTGISLSGSRRARPLLGRKCRAAATQTSVEPAIPSLATLAALYAALRRCVTPLARPASAVPAARGHPWPHFRPRRIAGAVAASMPRPER